MSVEHVKSTPITNLDASPVLLNTAGEGGMGYLREVSAAVSMPASSSADSTFRYVRVPTTAKIKSVAFTSAAAGGSAATDIGVYYPTTGKTGVADLVANAIDRDFFATAVVTSSAIPLTDVTFEAGAGYLRSEINTPLWQALGLTSDPGGFFDIVASLTVAVDVAATETAMSVQYVD